jgi:protein-disulfide isomerase
MADLNRRVLMGLTAAAALVFGMGATAPAPAPTSNLAEQMTLGNPKARVEVVEYASASCPHCGRFDLQVFPAFKKKYIDTGKVHFVFREVLTPPVELAAAGFLLARCGGRDKYFPTLDKVFDSQKEWREGVDLKATFLKIAQDEGVSEAQFNACMSDQTALKALNDRVEKFTAKDKVDSTPTFFVNGQRLQAGTTELDLASLDALIQPALKGKAVKR